MTTVVGVRERRRRTLALTGVVLITVLTRLGPAILIGAAGPEPDRSAGGRTYENYREMAEIVARGDNIYAPRVFFPYMPYSQVIPAGCLWLSRGTGLPFLLAMRIPNILADAIAAAAIFLVLAARSSVRRSFLWTLAFALNPVSILVSAVHGNLMGLVASTMAVAFCMGVKARACGVETRDGGLWSAAAALVLGCAIAMRSFPLLLVPSFVVWLGATWRRRLLLLVLASSATIASALPFLIWVREDFLREALGYSGTADFGWLAALRAIPLVLENRKLFAFGADLLSPSKGIFIAAFALSLVWFHRCPEERRRRLVFVAPLLFFGLYGGVAAQYLVWIVPLAALFGERRLAAWSVASTAALLAFYRVFHPDILFGGMAAGEDGTLWHVVLLAANVALVVLSLAWCADILAALPPGVSPGLVRLAILSCCLAFAALIARGVLETLASLS